MAADYNGLWRGIHCLEGLGNVDSVERRPKPPVNHKHVGLKTSRDAERLRAILCRLDLKALRFEQQAQRIETSGVIVNNENLYHDCPSDRGRLISARLGRRCLLPSLDRSGPA